MLTLDVSGIQQSILKIERFRVVMPDIVGDEVTAQAQEFADSGRAPNGSAWPPLTRDYAKRKQAKYGNSKPNKRATGGFLLSVKNRSGVVGPDAAHTPQGRGLEKKRVSFQVSPITVGNVERKLKIAFDAAS